MVRKGREYPFQVTVMDYQERGEEICAEAAAHGMKVAAYLRVVIACGMKPAAAELRRRGVLRKEAPARKGGARRSSKREVPQAEFSAPATV